MEEDRPATPQEEALSALQYRSEEVYQTTESIYDRISPSVKKRSQPIKGSNSNV